MANFVDVCMYVFINVQLVSSDTFFLGHKEVQTASLLSVDDI